MVTRYTRPASAAQVGPSTPGITSETEHRWRRWWAWWSKNISQRWKMPFNDCVTTSSRSLWTGSILGPWTARAMSWHSLMERYKIHFLHPKWSDSLANSYCTWHKNLGSCVPSYFCFFLCFLRNACFTEGREDAELAGGKLWKGELWKVSGWAAQRYLCVSCLSFSI